VPCWGGAAADRRGLHQLLELMHKDVLRGLVFSQLCCVWDSTARLWHVQRLSRVVLFNAQFKCSSSAHGW
jgi:hypothetical protein